MPRLCLKISFFFLVLTILWVLFVVAMMANLLALFTKGVVHIPAREDGRKARGGAREAVASGHHVLVLNLRLAGAHRKGIQNSLLPSPSLLPIAQLSPSSLSARVFFSQPLIYRLIHRLFSFANIFFSF